jgi:hypothetical protein
MLTIPVSLELLEKYKNFNQYMKVHQDGVILSWQARVRNGKIFIGVAGTKAYYGDQKPNKDHEFTKDRNLLQLNIVNDVLPEFISIALGRDTKGQTLQIEDLYQLERAHIAERWAGIRAVAYDGFPTLGAIYTIENKKIENGRCTTHLGSGGASFSPAVVAVSQGIVRMQPKFSEELTQSILTYGSSRR